MTSFSPPASFGAEEPRLKVLFVTPSFFPAVTYGGPTESTYRLAREIATKATVEVLTTHANGPQRLSVGRCVKWSEQLTVHYCRRVAGQSVSISLLWHLPQLVLAADVVHLTAVYSFPTLPTLVFAALFCKPMVWSPRGGFLRWSGTRKPTTKRIWDVICALVAPGNVVFHVTSHAEEDSVKRRFGGCRIIVLPNGVEVPSAEVRGINRSSHFRVLFLGRLDPIKGIDALIRGCGLARPQEPFTAVRLTIAGEGSAAYTKELERIATATGVQAQVAFVGRADTARKRELFAETDVFVLPSHSENFGMVVAEALAHGVPVIASTGTPWSEVQAKHCGMCVDNSPAALAAALEQMMVMPRAAMGERGREWMEAAFRWSTIADDLNATYTELAASNASNRTP